MKISLKVAVAGALALAGANAFALDPGVVQTAVANGQLVSLYVSGATASDGALENLFKVDATATRVCVPGSLDIYYFKSGSGSVSQRALTCTAGFSANGITSGTTPIALFKESAGGSANGIVNPATGAALQFIDVVNTGTNFVTACATATGSGNTVPGALGTWESRDCGFVAATSTPSIVTRAAFVPTAGVSDVDPGTFVGTGGVTAAHDQALTRKRLSVAVTFNPIVSVPLFTALQRSYGTITDLQSETTANLADVPSLPSALIRAVFNGTSVLNASEVNIGAEKLNAHLDGFADTSGDIYVCRRGDTSGTMTSFKLHFLGQGCSKNPAATVAFVAPDVPSCQTSGCTWSSTYFNDFVFAGSGSGDVRSCVDYHSSQGRLAIGVASTESKPNTTTARFRYVKVDGVEPTLKAVMEGRYSFFTENTFNDRYPASSTTGPQSIWDKVAGSIGTATALSAVNSAWTNSVTLTGPNDGTTDTGILDVASASNAATITSLFAAGGITGTEVRSTPVNSQTRQTLGGAANNCNQPYQAYP
jgi:hypothetical protein